VNVAFVLFPNVTQLDLMGPLQVLSRLPDSTTHVVAGSREPVPTDCGVAIVPTASFDEVTDVDLLCVPGGYGVVDALADPALMDFVRDRGRRADWVTSVCTGAFVLGVAGLLTGKRATTHWAYRELLRDFGAEPVDERVVRDGGVVTGGGVTAGIDFALSIAREIFGDDLVASIQLAIEYDPAPPLNAGSPKTAPASVLESTRAAFARRIDAFGGEVRERLKARS